MPSKSPAQARLMAGIAHGWKPSGLKHAPPTAVATEFNQADKGSALLRNAMKNHARGGTIAPPTRLSPSPIAPTTVSPLASAIAAKSAAGPGARFGSAQGRARAKPPRVPISGTLRNIDQTINKVKPQLGALGAGVRAFDGGGRVAGLSVRAISAIKDALSHLANKDASSASATLRSSPEAMAHPVVQGAATGLRSSTGIAPATKALTSLVNDDTNARTVGPTFRRGGRA